MCMNNTYAVWDVYKKPLSRRHGYRVDVTVVRSCVQASWCPPEAGEQPRQTDSNWRKSGPSHTEWRLGIRHKDSVWLPVRCFVCRICPFNRNMLPLWGEDTRRHRTIGYMPQWLAALTADRKAIKWPRRHRYVFKNIYIYIFLENKKLLFDCQVWWTSRTQLLANVTNGEASHNPLMESMEMLHLINFCKKKTFALN